MKHYTVRNLRIRLKEALDFADQEEEIVIHRGDKIYVLKVPMNPQAYE